ncbi:uncharacterized protein I303_104963 [Kwoniella dejecticola CBS 10117]|uniref:Zn(2)-C6 fungal-type domain-containing protein n=1 Tax=Kwoniella dejecticola CBS 10117 TaxID=1296121 RepID=A0A1A6A3U4_9TREE|nr:uncharacterized protein I303_05592 [Kwoniella dejecticola CBS 10117]OBR84733.1 hypothetical protein I303_05592 [Kwoniella dejecticola CBS 10117]
MPPKRKATDSSSQEGSVQPASQSKRATHTSRACDNCRRRKIRCDGQYPLCGVCKERNCPCEYKDEDKRKTHQEHMEELNTRMDRFEKLIEDLLKNTAGLNQPNQQQAQPSINQPYNGESSNPIQPQMDTMTQPSNGVDAGFQLVAADAGPSWTMTETPAQPMQDLGSSSFREHSDSGVSPVASTRLRNLGGTNGYERFQRVEEAAGALLQYGPTSLWTCTSPRQTQNESPAALELQSGDWIDWSHNLPSSINISKSTHDQAMDYFGAFYAPWGVTIDMPAFLADLNRCNLVRAATQSRPVQTRTASYSPLLHCCAIYFGLRMIKHEHPTLMKTFEAIFIQHCMPLLLEECDHTALSSLRAYNLYATCVHFVRGSLMEQSISQGHRQVATGYLYSGMAIAGVHALGLNVNCADYVSRGLISEKERNLREYAFWSIYISDTLRALAAGRQPMFESPTEVPPPTIDPTMDDTLWIAPSLSSSGVTNAYNVGGIGVRSMRSTTFHWMTRLAGICRSVLETLYTPTTRGRQEESLDAVSRKLDDWYRQFPLRPAEMTPLPHILLLHMYYHLTVIFIHRPFYRGHRHESAERCNQSAVSILDLLHVFKRTHQTRFAHHNMINVIFGAATIFLLRIAEPSAMNGNEEHKRNFDQCVDFMAQLSLTWLEAGTTRNILVNLQTEYELPRANPVTNAEISTSAWPWVDPTNDMQDIWGMMFNDNNFQWQDFQSS